MRSLTNLRAAAPVMASLAAENMESGRVSRPFQSKPNPRRVPVREMNPVSVCLQVLAVGGGLYPHGSAPHSESGYKPPPTKTDRRLHIGTPLIHAGKQLWHGLAQRGRRQELIRQRLGSAGAQPGVHVQFELQAQFRRGVRQAQ